MNDYFCVHCGVVVHDVIANPEWIMLFCDRCDTRTMHDVVIQGGMKSRYRFNDFSSDLRAYRGQCEISVPEAYTIDSGGDEIPVLHKNGDRKMNEQERYSGDRKAERRDMVYHDTDRKRGHLPVFFDQKRA